MSIVKSEDRVDSERKAYVGNETIVLRRSRYRNDDELTTISTKYLETRARLAVTLIEKWGMVAADVDGEDSSGRAKARVMTPSEVVSRACTTADLALSEFARRGWVHEVPESILLGLDPEES